MKLSRQGRVKIKTYKYATGWEYTQYLPDIKLAPHLVANDSLKIGDVVVKWQPEDDKHARAGKFGLSWEERIHYGILRPTGSRIVRYHALVMNRPNANHDNRMKLENRGLVTKPQFEEMLKKYEREFIMRTLSNGANNGKE